ncbi:aminotransferase class I/II-fold pyridoxal phosphate-dependent enzyme [Oceanobacillus halophilus]|uniref:Aminotransferase class I/II-fold pyridoxal phosphate-dependent enzyme n=1 Tax=Oceanobacillus halophilus TaxID=930130 RepID=A0A495A1T7_9BACI|nr:aminotransferase class I/II-fold pyridoxal phosphate-dependent enzyme [Oceanobacillus halophilus]RKQ33005.1 aminotransferase class I/II-fold pyridoxal phosphate-dependent enzyme [Oceanobacillus halophilus]
MNQTNTPLFSKLQQFTMKDPVSFHVPGHKNGQVFSEEGVDFYKQMLRLDLTELSGLDDLHAPSGVIQEAEQLAAEFFKAEKTFFLVGGSTVGNLAMVLATCHSGDKVIVQRNCHKSIMNALELSGAHPIFIAPEYDSNVDRYTSIGFTTLTHSLERYPDAKAVVLTYPDYFGRTYEIKRMIELTHEYGIPVLVDEAHGVHFSLDNGFPTSALQLGADVVVQSAHKMAPAMTQGSYLHIKSRFILKERVAHYLQMLQSSSPSYPLMASLDLARAFLAAITPRDMRKIKQSVECVRGMLNKSDLWDVLPLTEYDDFLKITLHVKQRYSIQKVVNLLETENIFPELHTNNQILLIHGLAPFNSTERLEKAIKRINEQLKNDRNHATIDITKLFTEKIQELALSYQVMNQLTYIEAPIEKGIGNIAAEAIIPYPPGIPLILKGERITEKNVRILKHLLKQGVRIQQRIQNIKIYTNEQRSTF